MLCLGVICIFKSNSLNAATISFNTAFQTQSKVFVYKAHLDLILVSRYNFYINAVDVFILKPKVIVLMQNAIVRVKIVACFKRINIST